MFNHPQEGFKNPAKLTEPHKESIQRCQQSFSTTDGTYIYIYTHTYMMQKFRHYQPF